MNHDERACNEQALKRVEADKLVPVIWLDEQKDNGRNDGEVCEHARDVLGQWCCGKGRSGIGGNRWRLRWRFSRDGYRRCRIRLAHGLSAGRAKCDIVCYLRTTVWAKGHAILPEWNRETPPRIIPVAREFFTVSISCRGQYQRAAAKAKQI